MVWISHLPLHLQCSCNANNDAAWVIPSYITDNNNTNVIEQDAMTTWLGVLEFRQVYLLHHRNEEALSLLQEYPG